MSSEGGSSKSATIEMYAPSSYNETVNGETLSSISEKSESYSQNGSHSDYAVSLLFILKKICVLFSYVVANFLIGKRLNSLKMHPR